VVDAMPRHRADRVFVLQMWRDTTRLAAYRGAVREVNTINGKSWPNTEHLDYKLGDTIRWRVINGSLGVHPMHLHGAYFNVLSKSTLNNDSLYTADEVRQTVTERMPPLSTIMME